MLRLSSTKRCAFGPCQASTTRLTFATRQTRAMALEVDALVRSIEDEKIEEDEREKVRDVLARIDGIKDKVRHCAFPSSSPPLTPTVCAGAHGPAQHTRAP